MTADARKPTVFISHQWQDKQVADRLARDLEAHADVWIDYRTLRPGQRIQDTIDEALQAIDIMLIVWTPNAEASAGVGAEIETALRLGTRMVPCFFAHDENGRAIPRLRPDIASVLGVDFLHYATGLAHIAELILHVQSERLPAEVAAELAVDPGRRLLNHLRGYLGYLTGYRRTHGVQDQRAEWVDRIITEIERYVESGGDIAAVRMLLEAARNSDVEDAEGIGMLIARLERLPGITADSMDAVDSYIDAAPRVLEALRAYAKAAASPAGTRVVAQLRDYLDAADDLIPDHHGRAGLLDDAWLINNTAFRLIESGVVPAVAVPVDWRSIIATDHLVRAAIPPDALAMLTTAVFDMLQTIAQEVVAYQPWFTPHANGYAPVIAAPAAQGGTWEDRMNAALLGTGLSVDG